MPRLSAQQSPDNRIEQLSPRRREVLELLTKGLTNDDVARVLGIAPGTVRVHVASLLAELDVANRTEATAAYFEWKAGAAQVTTVLERPAIAVLAFTSLDRSRKGELLATAVTHDLTTLFARWCWFPVIPATAARVARTASASPRELGRTLGARFLVDGALRAAGSTWRLSVRLDDAEDGRCLWAERFDFPGEDLFDLQDAVCATIVATTYEVLVKGLASRVASPRHPGGLDSWALAHEGMILRSAREPRSNASARDRFTAAIDRDPHLVLAHFGLGLCHYDAILNQWGKEGAAADRLLASAERCIELAPHAAVGYFLVGRHFQARGRPEEAVRPLEMAVARNPSDATAHALLAQLLAISMRHDEALSRMRHAERLAPRSYTLGLAVLHFVREEDSEALEHAERALSSTPGYALGRVLAAASAWWLGDSPRARGHMSALRAQRPDFSAEKLLATFGGAHAWKGRIAKALGALGEAR